MAYVVELIGRKLQKGKSPSGTLKYQVEGTSDQAIAYGLVLTVSPNIYEGLIKQNVNVEELGPTTWEGSARYGILERGEPGEDPGWSFEISSQQTHTSHALEHKNDYPRTGLSPAPSHDGAINVRRDGSSKKIDGTEVNIPVFTFEETHYTSLTTFTDTYIRDLEAQVATMNENNFRIWAPAELLLLGVTGQKRGEESIALTFRFASSRTKTNFSIGSNITGVMKRGWDYLWIEYEDAKDPITSRLTPRAIAAHTERVYPESDFTDLGLSDPWNKG